MIRNTHIVVTSIIVVALFVLLVYPEIVPVNAPPHLKTFKDLFDAFVVHSLLALFVLTALVNAIIAMFEDSPLLLRDTACVLFCVHRC